MPTHIGSIPQGLRYFVAGGFATCVTWLVRFPLSTIMPFGVAVAVAQMIGMVFGFIGYRKFVFPASGRLIAHQVRDFILVNALTSIAVTAVAVTLVDSVLPFLGVTWQVEGVAHALAIAFGAFLNFYGHKFISFRQDKSTVAGAADLSTGITKAS